MIGPWWRATAGRTLLGAALLAAPACREPAPAPPAPGPAPAHVGTCPLPLVRGQSDRTVPARLQLTNRTPERLVVFVDACRSHVRWGALEPGRTAVLRLPGRLYPYRGGMRLHAYSSYPRERYGTYIAPLEGGPVLRFTMTPAGAEGSTEAGHPPEAPPEPAAVRDAVPARPTPEPGDVHRTDSGLAYMTLWSEGRRVSLTWLCRDDDSTVHLAGPGLGAVSVPPVVVRATLADWDGRPGPGRPGLSLPLRPPVPLDGLQER